MKKMVLVALPLLALASGCKSACRELGERICACQPVGSPRDTCNSQVANVLSGEKLGPADDQRCEALLKTCADPLKDGQMCARLNTEDGKIQCGMAFPRDGGQ